MARPWRASRKRPENAALARREGERLGPAPPNSAGALAQAVLAVQRGAGNAAAGALIARAPLGTEAAPAKGGDKPKAGGATLTLSGVGSFPVESVSLPPERGPGTAGGDKERGGGKEREGGKEKPKPRPGEIVVTKLADELSATLARLAAEGSRIDGAELVMTGMTIKLKNVIISGYQTGAGGSDRPIESLSLNAESIEFVPAEQPGE